jgi:hypothetical protein
MDDNCYRQLMGLDVGAFEKAISFTSLLEEAVSSGKVPTREYIEEQVVLYTISILVKKQAYGLIRAMLV